jgi:mannobiose 2-epimerase
MNTHLHILEPYTNLFRIWKDARLEKALAELIELFYNKIENPRTHHLSLFFDEEWHVKGSGHSFGHDIEASWLLLEAAKELATYKPGVYGELLNRVTDHTRQIAFAALQGLQPDGSLIYEVHTSGRIDSSRHWWVQAETVVGLYYLYVEHQVPHAMGLACSCWDYIKENHQGQIAWRMAVEPGQPHRRQGRFLEMPLSQFPYVPGNYIFYGVEQRIGTYAMTHGTFHP